mmetsp:Transcript_35925/g.48538  ORF Transcript_35925/g.48538 Transcript_35925/m.48538 type:complete len:131 (-) Transcript_35925:527-919(-)
MIGCGFYACGANFSQINQCAVTFLDCMDSTIYTTAERVGEKCADAQDGLDYSTMDTCYAGSQGDDLMQEASDLFNAQYPGSCYIPAVAIDGDALDSVSQSTVESGMCAAGSSASICKEISASTKNTSCLV